MTEEEFKIVIDLAKVIPGTSLNNYIEQLSEDLKLKYIDLYNFDEIVSFNKLLSGIDDKDNLYKILKISCSKITNSYVFLNLFKSVPQDYKEEFLSIISDREKELGQNIIESYNIVDFLREFDMKDRKRIFKEVIFEKFWLSSRENDHKSRFGSFSYTSILEAFKDEMVPLEDSSMFDVLKFIGSKVCLEKDEITGRHLCLSNVGKVLEIFYNEHYDIKEVLRTLINLNYIDNTSLFNLLSFLPSNVKKDVLYTTIDSFNNAGIKINDFNFYDLINELNQNEIIETIDKYVVKDKLFSYIHPFDSLYKFQVDNMFFINTVFSLLPREELDENFGLFHTKLISAEKLPKYDVIYKDIVRVYSEKFDVNYDNLTKFIEKFGFSVLKFIDNDNIRKYINLPLDNFEKLLSIFSDKNLYFDKNIKNDVVNSLLQRQFMLKNPEIYNIFSTFEVCVYNKNEMGVRKLLDDIQSRIEIDEYLTKNNINYEQFVAQIMKGKFGVLNQITSRYIAYEREQHVRTRIKNIDSVLLFDRVISRESYKKDYFENHNWSIHNKLVNMDRSIFTKKQLELIDNSHAFYQIMDVKKNPKDYELTPQIRSYLNVFNELLDVLYDNKVDFERYNPNYSGNKDLIYNYVQKEVNPEFLLGILVETNFNGLMNTINNPELFEKLDKFLGKYKIIGWDKTFEPLIKECDLTFSEGTLAGLIGNFDKINERIENPPEGRKVTITSIIDYGNCYSSVSKFYSQLFGRKDFNLIVVNDGRNKASMSKYNRLQGCYNLIPDMYNRNEVTTPPINQVFTLSNGKKTGVVLGNSTNMMNLTYGERTESCMRMGGAFNDLFHYCIQNRNGFHIRFVNPDTGEFISRVSGFRNGNTVFLNELRDSVDNSYDNEELYETLKMVSEYLISESKDSEVPIDNILITPDYALKDHINECQEIKINDRKKAFRGLNFNITDEAIVLATSTPDNSLVPYNFRNDIPAYDVVRDQIKTYEVVNAIDRIRQLRMMNEVINGTPLEEIDVDYPVKEYDYIVSGEDFYVGFENNKTDVFVLDKSKDDMRTKMEIAEVLKKRNNSKSSKGGVRK